MAFSIGGFDMKSSHGEVEGLELGFVRFTRGIGRKRILISISDQETNSNSDGAFPAHDSPPVNIPWKRQKDETTESDKSVLESLHQDILIRVLCHVDHEDILTLKCVSKTIRKAVIEAKKSYFDYNTPRKRMAFRDPILILDEENSNQEDEIEAPNAPIRRRNIIRESDLSKISMVLFK